jgi:hypothetical protein
LLGIAERPNLIALHAIGQQVASFPSATAAGFFAGPVGSAGAFSVAISTIILASWLGSRGILDRLSIAHLAMIRSARQIISDSN